MTNTLNSPTQGFAAFQKADGSAPTAGMTPVWIASTDAGLIFRGDPVVTSSSPGTNNSGAYITSVNSISLSAGFLVRGIFQGCYQFQPSAGRIVWSNFYNGTVTGSTADIKAYVIDDPDAQFLVQASTKGAITSSMIGLNVGITFNTTTGNTTTGYSNVTVESTAAIGNSSMPFRLVDFYSAYAPGGGAFGNVNFNSSVTGGLINGLDNGNPANLVIVRMNNCDRISTTSKSC